MTDDEWLNTDIEAEEATGPAAAALLESVAETLREAPEGKRYDIDLAVIEDARKHFQEEHEGRDRGLPTKFEEEWYDPDPRGEIA